MDMVALFFSFLAGILSTLSPCVLPILPIIVSSSLQYKLKGLLMLVLGLSLSFALTGSFITYATIAFDFDANILKYISTTLLLFFGLILVIDKLNIYFVQFMSSLTNKGNEKLATFQANSAKSQFVLGLLLGFVWTPCVGATLGAAISLAIQGESLFYSFLTMVIFSIGASLPLLFIGLFSNKIISKYKINENSNKIKKILGFTLILLSILIFSGGYQEISGFLIEIMPDWWIDLTIRY